MFYLGLCVRACVFFTFITAVADACVLVYLPVHVRLVPHPWCSLNSVDAVLSEDIAARVPTLGGGYV